VPEAERAQLFERFRRGSRPRTSDGAGLGLAIVQAITHGHGGAIYIDDVPGGGARFTISLPGAPRTLEVDDELVANPPPDLDPTDKAPNP
jgi:signal transduction histidine kinase